MLLRTGLVRTIRAGMAAAIVILLVAPASAQIEVGHPSGTRGGALVPSAHTLNRGALSLGMYGTFTRVGTLNTCFGLGSAAYGLSDAIQFYFSGSNFFSGSGDTYFDYAGMAYGWAFGPVGLTFRLPRPRTAPFQIALNAAVTPGVSEKFLWGHNHPYARDSFDISFSLTESFRVGHVDLRAVQGVVIAEDTGTATLPNTNIPNHLQLGGGFTWWVARTFGLEAELLSRFELEEPVNAMEDYLAAGGGAVWGITPWLNLRGGYYLGLSEDPTDGTANRAEPWAAYGSLEIVLWNERAPVARRPTRPPAQEPGQPITEVVPGDADGDGVPDELDQEPNTPAGAIVDEAGRSIDEDADGVPDGLDMEPGTPAGAVVDAEGRAVDTDGDGVPDGIDLEPETLTGAYVDSTGVALDTDNDGVPDGLDLEPATIPGVPVDALGVGLIGLEADLITKGLLTLNTVYFDFNATNIKPESFATLREVGLILTKYEELKIEIGGHTDNIGGAQYNQQLSLARAEAVLNWLLDNIPELTLEQFTAFGYGLSQPVASNDTEEGRTLNRRVEFKVLNTSELEKYRREPPPE